MIITKMELAVLKAIDWSEYGSYLNDAVWFFSVRDHVEGVEPASLGGVIASLSKKGLVRVEGCDVDEDDIIYMTKQGAIEYLQTVGDTNACKQWPESL